DIGSRITVVGTCTTCLLVGRVGVGVGNRHTVDYPQCLVVTGDGFVATDDRAGRATHVVVGFDVKTGDFTCERIHYVRVTRLYDLLVVDLLGGVNELISFALLSKGGYYYLLKLADIVF